MSVLLLLASIACNAAATLLVLLVPGLIFQAGKDHGVDSRAPGEIGIYVLYFVGLGLAAAAFAGGIALANLI